MSFKACERTNCEVLMEQVAKWHSGQTDKGGVPIIDHVIAVAVTAASIAGSRSYTPPHYYPMYDNHREVDTTFAIGLCHDVLEDCDVSFFEFTAFISELYGEEQGLEIVSAVLILTHSPDVDYGEYISGIAQSGNLAAIEVKLADLMNNTNPRRENWVAQAEIRMKNRAKYIAAIGHLADARQTFLVVPR